jgi:hypothetical protein
LTQDRSGGLRFSANPPYVAVARAPDRIPEADAADGAIDDLPGRDGHAFADADGLSIPIRKHVPEFVEQQIIKVGHESLT